MTGDTLRLLRVAADRVGVVARASAPARDRQSIVNGIRMHWLEWGSPSLPTIVFLHGSSLNAHTWDLLCVGLADRYRCIPLDLRGHGDSEWPADGDYSLESYTDDVRAFLQTLPEPPVVVGMSLGGLVALLLAADLAVRALVMVDIGPEPRDKGSRRIGAFLNDARPATFDEYYARATEFNPQRDPELLRRSLRHNLRTLPDGLSAWKWDPRHIRESSESRGTYTAALWAAAASIATPTLIVRGAESEVFLEEDAERLAATIPTSKRVTVPHAGHAVQGDNPAALLQAIETFLTKAVG